MPADARTLYWFTLAGTLAGGWAATVWYQERRRRRRARRRERYLDGLRYLLDEKSDRAIEVFHGLAAVDDGTVDTHFALGSLYRRSGEVERAIGVHQNIVARTDLDPRHRDAALTELARDYFRAGLYDRAEELFLQLASSGMEPAVALSYLVRIYEIQRDWKQAAETHERLRAVGVPEQPGAIAHYYCELAEAALAERDLPAAHEHLRSAHGEQREFGRSAILRGDLARLEGDSGLAVRLYAAVVQRDFHLLPVVLPRLADVARLTGDEGVLPAVIDDLIRRGAASRAEIAYAAILSGHFDSPPIVDCVREWLQIDSDLKDLTGAFLPTGAAPSVEQLRGLSLAMRNVVLRHARYRCSQCGLDSSTFLWSCPGCHAWDTLRAIAALEFLPRAARPRSRQ